MNDFTKKFKCYIRFWRVWTHKSWWELDNGEQPLDWSSCQRPSPSNIQWIYGYSITPIHLFSSILIETTGKSFLQYFTPSQSVATFKFLRLFVLLRSKKKFQKEPSSYLLTLEIRTEFGRLHAIYHRIIHDFEVPITCRDEYGYPTRYSGRKHSPFSHPSSRRDPSRAICSIRSRRSHWSI